MKMKRRLIGIFLLTVLKITIVSTDDYEDASPIEKESYGLDLSETKLIAPEHPKYSRMLKNKDWYDSDDDDHVIIRAAQENPYAIPGDVCDYVKYQKYTETINVLKDHQRILDQDTEDPSHEILKKFEENYEKGEFNWVETCYHKVNKLQCNQATSKCECYEYENERKKGSIKLSQYFQYDPYTLRHYNNCVIQEKHSCSLSRLTTVSMQCETGLFCNSFLICEKLSSANSPSPRVAILGIVKSLHFKLYLLLLVIMSLFQRKCMCIFTVF